MSAAALALLSLALAAAGIYGVASFMVSEREREVGIRMALGASPGEVARMIVADGLRPVAYGALVGLGGAAAASSLIRATLAAPASVDPMYGAGALDPVTYVAIPLFLGAVAWVATYLPARRAVHVYPVATLRRD